jgi:hypothetical protein
MLLAQSPAEPAHRLKAHSPGWLTSCRTDTCLATGDVMTSRGKGLQSVTVPATPENGADAMPPWPHFRASPPYRRPDQDRPAVWRLSRPGPSTAGTVRIGTVRCRGSSAAATQNATHPKRGTRSHIRKSARELGAPLRNRTVDLLLTMDHQHVPEIASKPLTWPNACSRKQPLAAPGGD